MTFKKRDFSSVSSVSSVVAILLCVLCALLSAQTRLDHPPRRRKREEPSHALARRDRGGQVQYSHHCERCHGKKGLGDGPDVDRKDRKNRPANLAISRNPDGVMFYKIWNGRNDPHMPAFKSEMTKDEVWAVVAYITASLRPPCRPTIKINANPLGFLRPSQ